MILLPDSNRVTVMPPLLSLYGQVTKLPQGDWLFSRLFTLKAPYFGTVRPQFTALRPNYAELTIRKRRRVHNHIKTVHVIAICNGLEAAMGALAEATVPRDRCADARGAAGDDSTHCVDVHAQEDRGWLSGACRSPRAG